MKKIVEIISIVQDGNKDYQLSMRFKMFDDKDDPKIATPKLETEKSGIIKGQVEGLTIDDLIARTTDKLAKEFQAEVDRYSKEKEILSKIDTKTISDKIDVSKVVA